MIDVLPPTLRRILTETRELERAYLVGGGVRDWLLGVPCKDLDVEVFGVDYDVLVASLGRWGHTDRVGRSYGVVTLSVGDETFDFTLPRRDSRVTPGHQGFSVRTDPGLDPADAAARRDFTINALMFDPRRRVLLDFFGGEADLKNRVLRHTGPAFVEDPLRVLRGMRFAGRFDLTGAPETLSLCRGMAPGFAELATERVLGEWLEWASRSVAPSAGLRFLRDGGWLDHFPELNALIGVPQDPQWHPEGDVWTHTLHCLDALVALPEWVRADEQTRLVLSFAVLAHDFAKPSCTRHLEQDGRTRIVSPGHEAAGRPLAESFLERLGAPAALRERVPPLVAHHLAHLHEPTVRSVRRLASKLAPATIEELSVVMTADASGRPPLPKVTPPGVAALRTAAQELQIAVEAPRPILSGRHLIARGFPPGPTFRPILEAAFDAQLEGTFSDLPGAESWLEAHLRTHGPRFT